jgi:hypothetical protein
MTDESKIYMGHLIHDKAISSFHESAGRELKIHGKFRNARREFAASLGLARRGRHMGERRFAMI